MIPKPYLVFLGDVQSKNTAKTAFGVMDWVPDQVCGQWRLPECSVDLGVPDMEADAAVAAGAKSLLLGIAPTGGELPESWRAYILEAIRAGLDVVSGLHSRLADIPEIAEAAAQYGCVLHDIRYYNKAIPIASGKPRTGHRVLTVGTDCALGKKYAALAITQEMRVRGYDADFRATGQTGILIAGQGVPIDAVKADFVSGAAEMLSPAADEAHWDIIEGQGSLFHPAYAPVTLGLVHGSQPDMLILCHEPTRTSVFNYPDYPLPDLCTAMTAYEQAAHLTRPGARVVAVSLNTSALSEQAALDAIAAAEKETGCPATDPIRFGAGKLVDSLLNAHVKGDSLEKRV